MNITCNSRLTLFKITQFYYILTYENQHTEIRDLEISQVTFHCQGKMRDRFEGRQGREDSQGRVWLVNRA